MKINSLWISKHKNIENNTFDFKNELIALLVGLNGLGKSNILEAIVVIFKELDLATSEKNFIKAKLKELFDFRIEYQCKNHLINIETIDDSLIIKVKQKDSVEPFRDISFAEFSKNKTDKFFPDLVVGYYSGENKRIKELFLQHSTKRINSIKKSNSLDEAILGRLFFTEQNFGELIFFTLWIYKNSEKYGENIKRLLSKFLHIDFNSKVEIEFCNPDFYKNYPKQNAENLFSNIETEEINPFWGIKGDINTMLKLLYYNQSAKSTPISFIDEKHEKDKKKEEFVLFSELNYNVLSEELVESFDNPAKFFNVLHAADSLGIIYQINSTIIKHGASIKHNFKELSEGEQQLLTTIGLTLITGEYDSLLIFDEPDTHLNPQWQREYVELMHEFTINEENTQIIVATHSPLIVQAAEQADIFLFRSEEGKTIIDCNQHPIHNWRIDQILQSEYFGLISSRPPSLDGYMLLREKILADPSVNIETSQELKELENEFGVLPTGETITELKALQLINSIVNP